MVAQETRDEFDGWIGHVGEFTVLDLLGPAVNIVHARPNACSAALDNNEDAQRRSQAVPDCSEIRPVELERLIAEDAILIERRDGLELFRDGTAEQFERHTGPAMLSEVIVPRRGWTMRMGHSPRADRAATTTPAPSAA